MPAIAGFMFLCSLYIYDMSDITRLQQQLAHATEQLMIAETMHSQVRWGNRCDQLEAAIADLLAAMEGN